MKLSIPQWLVVTTLPLVFATLIPIEPAAARNYLKLVPSHYGKTNRLGNPIYRLEAYVNGKRYRIYKSVTGTSTTQRKNRARPNIQAPLPDGLYDVSKRIVPGNIPEVGRTFVAIHPQFWTRRSELGIHLDPSYNKRNGKDGTAGCIGLTTQSDRDDFNRYIKKYQPRTLIVKIKTRSS
jgi:hypothetical protein